jgi:glucuronokinase
VLDQFAPPVPTPLLPGIGGKTILSQWWESLSQKSAFTNVYLVSNALSYKHFERWASANDFNRDNIVNNGTTMPSQQHGAMGDVDLVIRCKNITGNLVVVAGDRLFESRFDLQGVINYFHQKGGELAICHAVDADEDLSSRGIVEFDRLTRKIVRCIEKPSPEQAVVFAASPEPVTALVTFACFRDDNGFQTMRRYLTEHPKPAQRSFGLYMQWLVQQTEVFMMKLPMGFHRLVPKDLCGGEGNTDYMDWVAKHTTTMNTKPYSSTYRRRAYARVGLAGNPSDGFFGKTLSLSIANFWAEVMIQPSEHLVLRPHHLHDPTEFGSLADLCRISQKEGYVGGLRLLQACCKKFFEYCNFNGIALPRQSFTLSYDTNVPRQVGLAGSSAIVTACLKALMAFYGLGLNEMSREQQPSFIMSVETEELKINAGIVHAVCAVFTG